MKLSNYRRILGAAALLALAFTPVRAQTLIADYPLTVNSNDLTGNFGPVTYGTAATQAPNACSDGTSASNIRTPTLHPLFNKQNFAVSVHFSLNSYSTSTQPRPIFLLDNYTRTIGVAITSTGQLVVYVHGGTVGTSATIALNQTDTVMLRYSAPNVQLHLNGVVRTTAAVIPLY